jgi:hypothetical protein
MQYTQDIFWNNLPYTKGRVSKKLGFLREMVDGSFLKNLTNPYFIWTGTGRIVPLEKKILHSKTINKLRNTEVYFYLYEPICARIGEYNRSFYSEFNSTENLNNMVCDEIESIKIFVNKNSITNFRIITSDYNIQLISSNYPGIKLNCLDTFLTDVARRYQSTSILNNVVNKFWCGNWRYTTHRHLIMSYLATLDGTYTWNLKCSYDELNKNGWFDLEKLKQENPNQHTQLKNGVDYLYSNIFSIDQNIDAVSVDQFDEVFIPGHNAPESTTDFLKSYRNSFCGVINETRFAQPFGYFSEKTLTAIHSKLPVIVVAPPHTLKYLKTFGFKTFDRWWDESYDTETNHHKRITKIFDIIDYINSKSIDELTIIYSEMEDILEHNRAIIKTIPFNDKIL